MSGELLLFYGFAALSVVGAAAMVLNFRNVVAGAMSLVVSMVALAGVYVLLHAHLVAVVQILVYAGAIVVLFLFVVMLLNLRSDVFPPGRQRLLKLLGVAVGALALVEFFALLSDALPEAGPLPEGYGGYRSVGVALYTAYVLPFEVASLVLLAAIVGAVVLAKRRID